MTKYATHLRRIGNCVRVTLHYTSGMTITYKRNAFLDNKADKQCLRLEYHRSENLERARCIIDHANGDADVLNVQPAVALAN